MKFSLLEMMVIIAAAGVLGTYFAPKFYFFRNSSQENESTCWRVVR